MERVFSKNGANLSKAKIICKIIDVIFRYIFNLIYIISKIQTHIFPQFLKIMNDPPHVRKMAKQIEVSKLANAFATDPKKVEKQLISFAKAHNDEMRKHHKRAYEKRMARTNSRPKKTKDQHRCASFLCSVQVNLSRLKTRVRKRVEHDHVHNKGFLDMINKHYLNKLSLTPTECTSVRTHRSRQVERAGEHVESVKGDQYIRKARALLNYSVSSSSADPFEAVVALAILTGRRTSEILLTISIHAPLYDDPKNPRKTHEQYWASMRGFLKHKKEVRGQIRRDIPLLATRKSIVKGLRYVREKLPAKSVPEINRRYSTQLNRRVQTLCGQLGTIHKARRLYGLLCHHYFRSEINPGHIMSLPRVVAHVLGHTNLSPTSLPYMNMDLDASSLGGIDFTKI